jgi:predicted  nucleic acid-binding Zn-ribbon protein
MYLADKKDEENKKVKDEEDRRKDRDNKKDKEAEDLKKQVADLTALVQKLASQRPA